MLFALPGRGFPPVPLYRPKRAVFPSSNKGGVSMDIKTIRKEVKEINKQVYPYNDSYDNGFHDAIEQVSKMIDKQMRKYARAKKKALKDMGVA